MDLFSLIFTTDLLRTSFYLIPFVIMLAFTGLAFFKPITVAIISTLSLVILYAWGNSSGSGALAIVPLVLMGRFVFTTSIIIFMARKVGNHKK